MADDMSQSIETTCIVSDTGNDAGNGSTVPITMTTLQAISKTMWAGVTIDLSGDIYSGDFIASLSGNPQGVITIKNGTIDGSIYTVDDYIILKDLVVYDADFLDRENNIPTHDGIRFSAKSSKLINSIVHDCRQGTLKDIIYPSIEYYGNVIFHNGWSAPDRGHGHGIYAANGNDTPLTISDCILYGQFGWGLHCYGESSGTEILKNIQVNGCTMFGNGGGNIIGGIGMGTTVRTSFLKSCYLYDNIQIGGVSTGCTDFTLQDCVIVGNLAMLYYGNPPTITGNKFFGTVSITNGDTGQVVDAASVFPDNEYLDAMPDAVYLRPNAYDANRANLTIFNGSEADTIEVDVSAIYANGTQVQTRNVQDYFTDIQNLTVTAGKIVVNMQAVIHTVATPQGWTAPDTTFPKFGCFVIEKV